MSSADALSGGSGATAPSTPASATVATQAATTATSSGEESAVAAAESVEGGARRLVIGGARFYVVPGAADSEPYPSVTSVLGVLNKETLNRWQAQRVAGALLEALTADGGELQLRKARTNKRFAAALVSRALRAPGQVADEAASVGTNAHEAIDELLLLAPDSAARAEARERAEAGDARVRAVVRNFERFERESGVTLLHRDTFVWSHTHRFAGAIDAVGRARDGSLVAFDWKTSKSLHNQYALQLGAYALAWNEMHPDAPVEHAVVVRFDKQRDVYEAKRVASLERAQDTFLAALTLWRATTPIVATPLLEDAQFF